MGIAIPDTYQAVPWWGSSPGSHSNPSKLPHWEGKFWLSLHSTGAPNGQVMVALSSPVDSLLCHVPLWSISTLGTRISNSAELQFTGAGSTNSKRVALEEMVKGSIPSPSLTFPMRAF